jgi:hypothetical protein
VKARKMLWWLWESFRVILSPLPLFLFVVTLGYAIWKDFIRCKQMVQLRHISLALLVLPIAIMMRNGAINYHNASNASTNHLAMLLQIILALTLVFFMRKSRVFAGVIATWMVFLAGNIYIYSTFAVTGII